MVSPSSPKMYLGFQFNLTQGQMGEFNQCLPYDGFTHDNMILQKITNIH